MLQISIAILLITNVLICPYTCWGAEWGWSVSAADESSCPCCPKPIPSHQKGSKHNESKLPVGTTESGCNCFCGEAVLDGGRVHSQDLIGPDSGIPLAEVDNLGTALHSQLGVPQLLPFLSVRSSGRDICILNCALLI